MALLSELFCSCFKWLIQIKHGILFLVKAAAALSELGCFYQCSPPPTPPTEWPEKTKATSLSPLLRFSSPGRAAPVCPQQPGLLLAMPLSLGCDCVVGVPPPFPLFYLFDPVKGLTFPLKAGVYSNTRVASQGPWEWA